MATNVLTIPYPEELLLSLKESPAEFEAEARPILVSVSGQPASSPWSLFGRMEIMRGRQVRLSRGRHGAGRLSSGEASALRRPLPSS